MLKQKNFHISRFFTKSAIEAMEEACHAGASDRESCDDVISRRAVLDTLDKMDSVLDEDRTVETYKELLAACYNDLPPVTPAHKTGRWIFVDKAHEHGRCSECDYGNVDLVDGRPHNYCPNCGAKIESEEK